MMATTRRDWLPLIVAVGVLLIVLVLSLAASASNLPEPPRYSYREARRTQRRYNQVVRYYRRQSRKDLHELRREHAQQQRILRSNKKHEKQLPKPRS